MIITCPSCRRKFNLPDDALKSPFQKLKCSKCSQVFLYRKEEEPDSGLTGQAGHEAEATPKAGAAPKAETFTPAQAPLPPLQEEQRTERRPRKSKAPLIVAIVILILAALGGAFYYYWIEYLGAGDKRLSIKGLEGQELVGKEEKVFYISGVVANGSTKPRKYIVLRAKLYDKDGTVLAEKDVLAGLPIPKEEAAATPKFDVERKINEFKLTGKEVWKVESGKVLPFSVIFFDEGFERAKEFTIEIIDSPLL
jgi:predicted Zn finger-like uncharacterized protein